MDDDNPDGPDSLPKTLLPHEVEPLAYDNPPTKAIDYRVCIKTKTFEMRKIFCKNKFISGDPDPINFCS